MKPLLTGITLDGLPFYTNLAFSPNSTFNYIDNSFKVETPLNWTLYMVFRIFGLERFYYSLFEKKHTEFYTSPFRELSDYSIQVFGVHVHECKYVGSFTDIGSVLYSCILVSFPSTLSHYMLYIHIFKLLVFTFCMVSLVL